MGGDLCPLGVSTQRGLCPGGGGLCPGEGVSVQEEGLSVEGRGSCGSMS